ncbi:hypothetical protein YTPLAS21_01800 [Candidatus Nitrosocosmicus sp.]|nr:hypothetical protein YTPLAS21_01800 [Candidatus Nitrosocosmicus sp.]
MVRILTLNVILVLLVLVITGPTFQGVIYQPVSAQLDNDRDLDMNGLFGSIQNILSNPFDSLNSKDVASGQSSSYSTQPNSYQSNDMDIDKNGIYSQIQSTLTDPLGQVDVIFPPGETDTMVPVNQPQPSSTDTMVPVNQPQPSSTDTMVPVNQPQPSSTDTMYQ